MALSTPPATLSKTFVPAVQQPRLGEHVVHGGDALNENIVLKASNSRFRFPLGKTFGISVTGGNSTSMA